MINILKAKKHFFSAPKSQKKIRKKKMWFLLVVITTFMIACFILKLSVNENFSDFIFSIFHIETKEGVPENTGTVTHDGVIDKMESDDIDGEVNVYYFKGNGIITSYDGLIYSNQYDKNPPSFYDLNAKGLAALPTFRTEFPYTFREIKFNIKFDYTVYDGVLHLRPIVENADENPYQYGWNIVSTGFDKELAWLILPYSTERDYGEYPLLLNVKTREITDVFEGISFGNLVPISWEFTNNMKFALGMFHDENYENIYLLYDLATDEVVPISADSSGTITGCYILDNNNLIYYSSSESGMDVVRYNISEKIRTTLVRDTQYYDGINVTAGFKNIQYYSGAGRYGLLIEDDGTVMLINLANGKETILNGIVYDNSILTSESPDGRYILFTFCENGISSSMYKFGVLNTETGVMKMLERGSSNQCDEKITDWLVNDRLTILAYHKTETQGWYLYVYDFR